MYEFVDITLYLLVLFANKICKHYNLDQDQDGQNISPDLDPNCLTLKEFLEKSLFLGGTF